MSTQLKRPGDLQRLNFFNKHSNQFSSKNSIERKQEQTNKPLVYLAPSALLRDWMLGPCCIGLVPVLPIFSHNQNHHVIAPNSEMNSTHIHTYIKTYIHTYTHTSKKYMSIRCTFTIGRETFSLGNDHFTLFFHLFLLTWFHDDIVKWVWGLCGCSCLRISEINQLIIRKRNKPRWNNWEIYCPLPQRSALIEIDMDATPGAMIEMVGGSWSQVSNRQPPPP